MKLHTRWQEARFGVFQRRTEYELYARIELDAAEMRVVQSSELENELLCRYRSHGLQMDTRLRSLVAGETHFGSEDKRYLEDIEKQISESVERLAGIVAKKVRGT